MRTIYQLTDAEKRLTIPANWERRYLTTQMRRLRLIAAALNNPVKLLQLYCIYNQAFFRRLSEDTTILTNLCLARHITNRGDCFFRNEVLVQTK